MQLQDFITPDTTVVECYLCPTEQRNSLVLNCHWDTPPSTAFLKQMHGRCDYDIAEYNHRHLTYQYDLATDMQKTIQRNFEKDTLQGKYYILSLHEQVLPSHRFPCTNEINPFRKFHRSSFKWNNRIFFNLDKEENQYTCYIRYNHCPKVDLDKMNEEWTKLLRLLQGDPIIKARV